MDGRRTTRMTRMTWTLWLALLAGHVAWSMHLMVSYFLASVSCTPIASGWLIPLHVGTALAIAGIIGGIAAGRAAAADPAPERRFVGRVGLALSAIFLFATALAGAMVLFLPPCA